MSNEYRNNHYVPEWYQKRFILPGQVDNELQYLDLNPGSFVDPRGVRHAKRALRRSGFRHCFAEQDLYTTRFGGVESRKLEKLFFGAIDSKGRRAVDYFSTFAHPSVNGDAFRDIMLYMSTQKLRTPKGLSWLANRLKTASQDSTLAAMVQLRQLHCAIWTECVWQIADASRSDTKFIISDHPVTVYNRACGPRSQWCRGVNDPDIWLNGTHTLFPLSLDKILILTNLSWVRNPYQNELSARPNPNPLRPAIIKFTSIQTQRSLSETEVRQINFIIKSRAFKYVAAAMEDWLHPEVFVSKSDWNRYGHGYLLMPDPRPVHTGGTIMWGGGKGPGGMVDEYGRTPSMPGFGQESRDRKEFATLQKFKGEFAMLFGRKRRGLTFDFARLDPEEDTEDFHEYHLQLFEKYRRRK